MQPWQRQVAKAQGHKRAKQHCRIASISQLCLGQILFLSCSFIYFSLLFPCFTSYKCATSLWDLAAGCGDARHERCFCPAHPWKHQQASPSASAAPAPDEALPRSADADTRQRHCFSITSSEQLFAGLNKPDWVQHSNQETHSPGIYL